MLRIFVLILLLLTGCKAFEAINSKPGTFRFENYKTAEEAQTALLLKHPLGSDLDPLIETLSTLKSRYEGQFSTKCGPVTNPRYKNDPKYRTTVICNYFEPEVLFATEWRTIIQFNEDSLGKRTIKDLKLHSFYQAL